MIYIIIYIITFVSRYNLLYNNVSSDPTEFHSMALSIRKDIKTTSESTNHSLSHVITMPDIKYVVKKVCAGKSGFISTVRSDCFIHSTDLLDVLLLWYLMLCYYTGDFQMIVGVYFNTDTKRVTCGGTENTQLLCNCTEQYS